MQGVLEREALGSTALCELVAVPHVRVEGIDQVELALLRLDAPRVLRENQDPIQLLLLLVSPQSNPALHLKALAKIARNLQEPQLSRVLLHSTDPQQIGAVFEEA